jgi:hypothetical protein
MALASDRVRSTSIAAQEFPELSGHYDVYSVPKIVINDKFAFAGGYPEPQFLDLILRGIEGEGPTQEDGETTTLSR